MSEITYIRTWGGKEGGRVFAQGERIITSLWHFEHADHIDVTGSNSQTVYTFYSQLNRQPG